MPRLVGFGGLRQQTREATGPDHATALLFDLPGVRVRHVERDELGARIVHVETAAEYAAGCPSCGVVSTAVKANAFIYTGTTNARTEGINRLIKQVKRSACGFRNTANIRRRIRFHCTRAQRGEQPQP